jgi:glycerol-3-phosphate acyltransferase PlsY
MNSGLHAVAAFAGSFPGLLITALGQTMVVVCLVFDMVRAVSVSGSHRRYMAATVFRTLALPSIISTAIGVLEAAASWAWMDVAMGTFVMVALIFRWHHQKDEDNWWKGKGKKLAKWARMQLGTRLTPAPALG